MKQRRESGFGVVEVSIIVIVLIIIGLLGWYFMRAKPAEETTQPTSSKTTPTNGTQSSGATKYLTITEWGVKFALTADTADAYYDANTSSSLEAMSLRSHSLDSEPDCTNEPQSIAAIFRVPKDAMDDSLPDKKYSETQDGQTIGDYFYFISGAQYACAEGTDMQVVLQGVRNGFTTAGPTIQKQ